MYNAVNCAKTTIRYVMYFTNSTLFFHDDRFRQYIEDIQVFGVNMSFISLSEVKIFLYFMSAEGTNEIYNFSLHEMK